MHRADHWQKPAQSPARGRNWDLPGPSGRLAFTPSRNRSAITLLSLFSSAAVSRLVRAGSLGFVAIG